MNSLIDKFAYNAGLYCDGTPDSFDQEAITKHTSYVIAHVVRRMEEQAARYPDQSTARMALAECIEEIMLDFGFGPKEKNVSGKP